MAPNLQVETVHGPVLGFADTFPVDDRSSASRIAGGENGGRSPVLKWLSIPYGQAGRWERPRAPEKWTASLECFEFGSYFPQPPSATNALIYAPVGMPQRKWAQPSEDSFTVNVFAPGDTRPDERLPVLVWIYGGSLTTGSATAFPYDPTELVRREQENGKRVVVVTGNYRVNTFGFLASKDLEEVDPEGLAGNYGIYDTVAYLTWVQENISKFGGSPDNVTVFGESAGGFLISVLLVHPAPLFRRAIMQSGFPNTMSVRSIEKQESLYQTLLTSFNITPTTHPTPASRVEALRRIPASTLANIKAPPLAAFGLTLEHGSRAIWKEHPGKSIREGKIRKGIEGVVCGINRDEGSLFAKLIGLGTPQGYKGWLSLYPPYLHSSLEKLYPPPEAGAEVKKEDLVKGGGSQGLGDGVFKAPMEHAADSIAKSGRGVWVYRFEAFVEKIEQALGLGATHAIDIPFTFNIERLWEKDGNEAAVSKAMGRMLTDFAITGSLGSDWPRWDAKERPLQVIGKDGSLTADKLGEVQQGSKREFWRQVIEKTIAG